ncbi:FAD-dependent oxidoreductase [Nonomuraea sp. SBT364]|uniref:FAD-dependent oxidoreductase n=1 Tax=Nonomuraea sp. SBT364 TaxID=1580530 RepID=UPI00066CDCEF|nr:NAD(P)/FAD-dependent oxidoreductase [Nonomuraea sp. SBT364]
MRVIVIGAGVAGLALARGLIGGGHEVEVYEEAPEPRTAGGSVSLWPGSTAILRGLGVDLSGAGRRLETLESWSTRGRVLSAADLTDAERAYGHPTVHVARGELVGLLAEGVPVTYGAAAEGVDPGRALARLAGGRTVRGDVLVGADGRRSAVRHAMLGGDPARLSGWATWQGFATEPTALTGAGRAVMIPGRHGMCGLIPAGGGRLLWWFDVRTGPGRPLWGDDPDPVGRLRRLFGGFPDPVPRILATMTEPEFFPHHTWRIPDVWGHGPTTLAGDSAHTMPPAMAQGANQALEDAWLLAGSITGDLRAYERARARLVRRSAVLAGTEFTNRHEILARLIPRRLATSVYTRWLRWASGYLLTAS